MQPKFIATFQQSIMQQESANGTNLHLSDNEKIFHRKIYLSVQTLINVQTFRTGLGSDYITPLFLSAHAQKADDQCQQYDFALTVRDGYCKLLSMSTKSCICIRKCFCEREKHM